MEVVPVGGVEVFEEVFMFGEVYHSMRVAGVGVVRERDLVGRLATDADASAR